MPETNPHDTLADQGQVWPLWLKRFEAIWIAWRPGTSMPRWRDFLPADDEPCDRDLIYALLHLDIKYRIASDVPALLGEHYFEHPRLQRDDACLDADRLVKLIEWEYQQRWATGQHVRRAEYQAAFPQLSAALQELKRTWQCPSCHKMVELEESSQTVYCPDCDIPSRSTVPPSPDEDDAAKVEKLLVRIAAQSHFEERYELREILERGGMGQIYRAYDRILRREVAIKMMRENYASESAAIRGQFLKEARVGGRLLHPHILAVFDLGVNRSGQIYYTMRLVDGASLQHCLDSLDKGVATKLVSYPLRKIVEALVKACHGVDFAHQNGVLHLDLKPQNILVSGFNEVFVIDWGLARVDEVDDTEELVDLYRDRSNDLVTGSVTMAGGGRIVGTPGYMAPEQAVGDSRSFDASTDVFGLGGVLHFILYGTAPNQGNDFWEILRASSQPKRRGKLRQGIIPRGQRVRKEVLAAIEALEAICLKALEPDKKTRYANVEHLLVELNEWLANTPGPPLGI